MTASAGSRWRGGGWQQARGKSEGPDVLCSAAAPRTLKFRKTTDRDANEPWTRERKPLRPDVDRGRRCWRATGTRVVELRPRAWSTVTATAEGGPRDRSVRQDPRRNPSFWRGDRENRLQGTPRAGASQAALGRQRLPLAPGARSRSGNRQRLQLGPAWGQRSRGRAWAATARLSRGRTARRRPRLRVASGDPLRTEPTHPTWRSAAPTHGTQQVCTRPSSAAAFRTHGWVVS